MNIYEADEIWSSVEYGNGDLRKREFVESEVAHSEINRLRDAIRVHQEVSESLGIQTENDQELWEKTKQGGEW